MNTKLFLTALVILSLSFGARAHTNSVPVDADNSTVAWAAKKVTGAHNGYVSIKEGTLIMDHGKLAGGVFVMDMATISVEDIKNEEYNAKLTGHLNSDDFFSTEKHPEARLVIKSAKKTGDNTYAVAGDITIKDITKTINFDASIEHKEGKVHASAEIVINRVDFDIRYRSLKFFPDIGDKMIYDNFNLSVSLVSK